MYLESETVGIIPEITPVRMMKTRLTETVARLMSLRMSIFPLKSTATLSSSNRANAPPMMNEMNTINVDSPISSKDIPKPSLPRSLRVAISFALKPVLATVRFM